MDSTKRVIKKILTVIDIIGYLSAAQQFLSGNYTWGTILTLVSLLLSLCLAFLDHLPEIQKTLQAYSNLRGQETYHSFLLSVYIYIVANIILLAISYITDSSKLFFLQIFVLPILISIFLIYLKLVKADDNFDSLLNLYYLTIPTPLYIFSIILFCSLLSSEGFFATLFMLLFMDFFLSIPTCICAVVTTKIISLISRSNEISI